MAMMGSGYERRPEPEAPTGPRLRVYELAKDLNVQPKDLVAKVRAMGIEVANHMSHLESVDVDRVRRAVDRERLENLEEVRLNDTVIRRRSKSAVAASAGAAAGAAARPAAPAAAPPPVAPPPAPRAPEPAAPVATAPEVSTQRHAREPEVVERPAPRPSAPPAPPAADAPPPAAPAMAAKPAAAPEPEAPPRPQIKTIPQPVVTGSAATGAFIQLPGTQARNEQPVQRFEIKDRDEEMRRLGRGAPMMRQPRAGGLGSAGPGSVRVGRVRMASPRSASPLPARS